jgi:hypothetical protein
VNGFIPVPNRLLEEAEDSACISVFVALVSHRNRFTGCAMPGIARIAEVARVSKPTAISAIKWLRDHAFVEFDLRPGRPGHRQGRTYRFPDLDQTGKNEIPVNNETGFQDFETGKKAPSKPVKNKHHNQIFNQIEDNQIAKSSNELPAAGVFNLPLKDGSSYDLHKGLFDFYVTTYPTLKVIEQLGYMRSWLLSNPKNRKSRSGITKFINGWLKREQDKHDTARKRAPRAQEFISETDYRKDAGVPEGQWVVQL